MYKSIDRVQSSSSRDVHALRPDESEISRQRQVGDSPYLQTQVPTLCRQRGDVVHVDVVALDDSRRQRSADGNPRSFACRLEKRGSLSRVITVQLTLALRAKHESSACMFKPHKGISLSRPADPNVHFVCQALFEQACTTSQKT